MVSFSELVQQEYKKATSKHAPMNSLHEGYAVILEELDELWVEIKKKNPNRTSILEELVQVAAMCQRLANDVVL